MKSCNPKEIDMRPLAIKAAGRQGSPLRGAALAALWVCVILLGGMAIASALGWTPVALGHAGLSLLQQHHA